MPKAGLQNELHVAEPHAGLKVSIYLIPYQKFPHQPGLIYHLHKRGGLVMRVNQLVMQSKHLT